MGSGSSRKKRSSGAAADRPGRRGGSSSAPSGPGREGGGGEPPVSSEPPDSSLRRARAGGEAEDSDWELLEEVLAECEEPGTLPHLGRGPPHRGPSSGDAWAGRQRGPRELGSGPDSGAAGGDQLASLTRSTQDPENNSFTSEFPVRSNKKPEVQSTISYDYSEEELMASIEREYCR